MIYLIKILKFSTKIELYLIYKNKNHNFYNVFQFSYCFIGYYLNIESELLFQRNKTAFCLYFY